MYKIKPNNGLKNTIVGYSSTATVKPTIGRLLYKPKSVAENGTNLTSPTAFTIGGQPAIVISNTGTILVAMVMPAEATGASAGGGNFTVTATPHISSRQGTKLPGTVNKPC